MKETEIQKAILEYLTYKGHFFFRCNTGAFKTQHGSFIRFGTKGAPDLIGCVDGKFIGLEVKTATGRLSDDQDLFADALREKGGLYYVVRSIDDVQDIGL